MYYPSCFQVQRTATTNSGHTATTDTITNSATATSSGCTATTNSGCTANSPTVTAASTAKDCTVTAASLTSASTTADDDGDDDARPPIDIEYFDEILCKESKDCYYKAKMANAKKEKKELIGTKMDIIKN